VLRPNSRRGLTYSDPIKLLGGDDSGVVAVLGRIASVGAAPGSAATLSAVHFFAHRREAVDWGNTAGGLRDRLTALTALAQFRTDPQEVI
jgi:hypothetical protein